MSPSLRAPPPPEQWRDWLPLAAVACGFIVFKAVMSIVMPPLGDEAYYWLWGQRPGLSYFDHPPLHAWLLGIVEAVFGWSLPALRLLTWATFLATLAIVWRWALQLAPAAPRQWFWRAALIYLASPLFLGMSTLAFNDHLMMALVLASAHAMLRFAGGWENGERRYGGLYLASLLLGLAVLAKYNAVFLGLGYLGFFFLRRPLRPLFLDPHAWLAALLGIAVQAPVFWWNAAEGLASYRFHLADRWQGTLHLSWQGPLLFVAIALVVVSPFLAIGVARYFGRPPHNDFAARARDLATPVFVVSSAAMLVLASFAQVLFYWNIVAFILLLPLVVHAMGQRWLFRLHVAYGGAMALLLGFNQLVAPVGNVLGAYDWTVSSTYGWEETARKVEALLAEHPGAFVATTHYTTAAQLAFALGDPEVTALSPRVDQFDFWFDGEAHAGRDAIVVADSHHPASSIAGRFADMQELARVEITSFGRPIYAPIIYLGRAYSP